MNLPEARGPYCLVLLGVPLTFGTQYPHQDGYGTRELLERSGAMWQQELQDKRSESVAGRKP